MNLTDNLLSPFGMLVKPQKHLWSHLDAIGIPEAPVGLLGHSTQIQIRESVKNPGARLGTESAVVCCHGDSCLFPCVQLC